MNRKLILSLLLLVCPRLALADSAGTSPFNFLFLDAGARPVAMGGAYTALAQDANALLYNPAGLGEVNEQQAVFMHNQYFQDITQEYLAYASPQGWGASCNYLDFGSMRRTTISNHTGAGLGSTGLTDLALSAGYGGPIGVNFVGGAGLKYIDESVAGIAGHGFGLDLGVMYYPPSLPKAVLGASVQNIGPSVKFQSEKEAMPMNVRLGAAYTLAKGEHVTVFSADLTKAPGEKLAADFGAETLIARTVSVRLGYNGRNDAGPGITLGLGYIYRDLSFDYAFVPFGDLGAAHRLSVGYKWGEDLSKPAEAAAPKKQKADQDKADPARLETAYERLVSEAEGFAAKKDYSKAADAYEKALAVKPDDQRGNISLADMLMKQGKFKEADRAYARALKLLPEEDKRIAYIYERRGTAMFRLDKMSAAESYFMRAVRAAEEQTAPGATLENSYYGLAYCQDKDGNSEDAITNYRRALQVAASEPLRKQIEKRLSALEGTRF